MYGPIRHSNDRITTENDKSELHCIGTPLAKSPQNTGRRDRAPRWTEGSQRLPFFPRGLSALPRAPLSWSPRLSEDGGVSSKGPPFTWAAGCSRRLRQCPKRPRCKGGPEAAGSLLRGATGHIEAHGGWNGFWKGPTVAARPLKKEKAEKVLSKRTLSTRKQRTSEVARVLGDRFFAPITAPHNDTMHAQRRNDLLKLSEFPVPIYLPIALEIRI